MAKKTKEVSVAKLGTQDIPSMLVKINENLKALRGEDSDKHKSITTALDDYGIISHIKSVEKLIQAYASVSAKGKAYDDSAKALGISIKNYPCKINKVTPAKWMEEIKLTILEVKNSVEIKELEDIKSMLEDNLSLEDKLAKKLSGYADKLDAFEL